jgi:glycosyltransferase involved in cell wall biosynthesis
MRILQVFPHYDYGGMATVLAMLSREWSRPGHQVLNWLPAPIVAPAAGLPFLSGDSYPDSWGADVVVVHGGLVGAADLGLFENAVRAPVVEILHRRQAARPGATHYVAVSRSVAEVQDRVACTVIPNGVRLPAPEVTRLRARAALGIEEGAIVVVRHGRIDIEKGWHWTMSVIERVWSAGLPAWLLVAGTQDGPAAAILRAWARDRRCLIRGWSQNPAELLIAADIYLETSPEEAFGLAAAEAALLGLPVVAFASPGVAETLGRGCPTAPIGDSSMAARMLLELAGDPRARSRLSGRLRRRVRTRFAPALCAGRYLRLFESLR